MKFWLATTRKYRYDSIISEIKNYNNAVCKFFNKKSVQIVEADSHISD